MKKIICACLATIALSASTSLFAYSNSNYNDGYSESDTHYVRPYVKQDGTYVEGHRSGNPGSGVHCHDNVCY